MSETNFPINPVMSDLEGNTDMRELIGAFVSELPDRINAIQQSLASQDLDTLTRLVHQLRGAAGGYGFRGVGSQAAEIESSIQSHDDLMRIAREVRELAEMCSRVRVTPAPQSCGDSEPDAPGRD